MKSKMKTSKLPRKGSLLYNIMSGEEEVSSKATSKFSLWNRYLMVPLYRANILPIFGIGRIFLLLYHYGRKSGREYITPLQFRKYQGRIVVFSVRGREADWYQNALFNKGQLKVKIGFRTHWVIIKEIDAMEGKEIIKWYVNEYPFAANKLIGWDSKRDNEQSLDSISSLLVPLEFALE
jgi:deazaflavin-dependent oxidoreductase (nitroreductase family)